ncbi:MAG: D-tyrosyl-tRNA(Tyr) deacylase [Treponema sp.]|jgi:D-tyrosyl-tRNA(Tyr) deacylase|nr:D-tyrosyl-tRNA(Tyr) deacylase [Treponema sp.]
MKAVVQRVLNASVTVEGILSGGISRGLLVYLGVARGDTERDAEKLAEKIVHLRIFEDGEGKMNLSIGDLPSREGTGILAVSQFTLLADTRKGRRPYYGDAADSGSAKRLYEHFMAKIRHWGFLCEAGVFQARMEVAYVNEGPVTILLDSNEFAQR